MPFSSGQERLELGHVQFSHGPGRADTPTNSAQHLDPGVLQGISRTKTISKGKVIIVTFKEHIIIPAHAVSG